MAGYDRWWIPLLLASALSTKPGSDRVNCAGKLASWEYTRKRFMLVSAGISHLTRWASVSAVDRFELILDSL